LGRRHRTRFHWNLGAGRTASGVSVPSARDLDQRMQPQRPVSSNPMYQILATGSIPRLTIATVGVDTARQKLLDEERHAAQVLTLRRVPLRRAGALLRPTDPTKPACEETERARRWAIG
jgi:hypothetical protein